MQGRTAYLVLLLVVVLLAAPSALSFSPVTGAGPVSSGALGAEVLPGLPPSGHGLRTEEGPGALLSGPTSSEADVHGSAPPLTDASPLIGTSVPSPASDGSFHPSVAPAEPSSDSASQGTASGVPMASLASVGASSQDQSTRPLAAAAPSRPASQVSETTSTKDPVVGANQPTTAPAGGGYTVVHPSNFGTALVVGAASIANGDGAGGYWSEPWEYVDKYGDVYVAYIANYAANGCFSGSGAGWAVAYAVSVNQGSSFYTKCMFAPGAAQAFVDPSIAVSPTGGVVCLVANYWTTANTNGMGDYYYYCTTSGVTALHGGTATWGTLTNSSTYNGLCGTGDGAGDGDVGSAYGIIDSNGYLLVAAWGYQYSACTSFGIEFDEWTAPASGHTHNSYFIAFTGATSLTSNLNGYGYYYGTSVALDCSQATANCAMFYEASNYNTGTPNVWYGEYITSTNDFSTWSGPTILARHAWVTTTVNVPVDVWLGGASYAPSGTDCGVVFAYDATAGSGAPSTTLNYSYSSNDFSALSAGNSPVGGATNYGDASLALSGSSAIPFVSFNDTTPNEWVTAAPSQSGTFSSSKQEMSQGSWGGMIGVCTPGNGCTVWEVDMAWTSTAATPQTYYSGVYAVSASGGSTSPANIDKYQSTTFGSVTVSNGITAYSYAWTNLPGCSSANSVSLACTATSTGTFSSVTITVTDAWGFTATVTMPSLVVNADPVVSSFSASPASGGIDAYQTTTWTPTITGGTGTISLYTWTSSSGSFGCANSGSTNSCTPTAAGSFTVSLIVEDSDGCYSGGASTCASPGTAAPSTSYTVYADPVVSTLTPSPGSGGIDAYQSTTWTPSITGGSGTISTYTWGASSGNFGCAGSGSTDVCTPTVAGTYTVNLIVKDSNNCYSGGASTCASPGAAVTSAGFVVDSDPVVSSFTPSHASGAIDVGQSVSWTASTTGGSGTISTYTWGESSSNFGCSGSGSTYTCTPTVAGAYTVNLIVKDSNNCYSGGASTCASPGVAVSSTSFTVDSDPTLGAVSTTAPISCSSSCSADAGQSLTASTSASGGSGGYTYTWSISAGSGYCSGSSTTATLSCTVGAIASTQTWTAAVYVTDSNGCKAPSPCTGSTTSFSVSLLVDPSGATTTSAAGIYLGQPVTLTTTPSNGASPYTYSWTSLPTGCSNNAAASLTCTPTAAGTYVVAEQVTDHNAYAVGSSAATLIIQPARSAYPSVTNPLTPVIFDHVGQQVRFSTVATGGTGNYTLFRWLSSSGQFGCNPVNADNITCTPLSSGSYNLSVNVTDSNNDTSRTATLAGYVVYPALAISYFNATPLVNDIGLSTTLSLTAGGGSGVYTFAYAGLPAGCTSANASTILCAAGIPGSFIVRAYVNDSTGSVNSTVAVNYNPLPSIATFSSNRLSTDVNHPLVLSASASGGTGSLAYVYTGLPQGCATVNLSTVTCDPSTLGTFSVRLFVNDSLGASAYALLTFSVNPALGVSSTLLSNPTDQSLAVYFSTTVSGGTGPFAYAWSFGDGAASSAPSPAHLYSSAGTYTAVLWLNDSGGSSAQSIFVVVVHPNPVATVSAGLSPVDAGVAETFDGSYSLGTGSFSFAWRFGDGGFSGAQNATHTYSLPGSYVVRFWSNDSLGVAGTAFLVLTVYPALSVVASASRTITDANTSLTFNAVTQGGSGITAYSWRFGDGLSSSLQSPSHSYVAPGTYNAVVYANDSSGGSAMSPVSVTVLGALVLTAGSVSNSTDIGSVLAFAASASGGTSPLSFQWYFGDGSNAGVPDPTHSYGVAGQYIVRVWANDSVGGSQWAAFSIAVFPDPTAVISSAVRSVLDVGQITSFTAVSTPGSGSPVYFWSGLPDGCPSASASMLICAPSVAGTYEVFFHAQDSNGVNVSSTPFVLTVDQALMTPVFALTHTSIDVGQSVDFSTAGLGGSGVYTYAWSGLPAGCASSGASVQACTPLVAGVVSILVTVTDSNGNSASTSGSLEVLPAVTVAPPSVAPAEVDLGQNITLALAPDGGTGQYTVTWHGLPVGCASTDGVNLTCTVVVPGTYSIWASVGDSNGGAASSDPAFLTVNSPLSLAPSLSSATSRAGDAFYFESGVSGGASPYVGYLWSFGDGGSSTQANPQHVYLGPGTYSVSLTVKDSAGATKTVSMTVTVLSAAAPPAPTIFGGPVDLGYALIALLIAVAAFWAFLVGLALQRRPPNHEPQ